MLYQNLIQFLMKFSSDNDEYNSTFINSLLTLKDECEKNIKNNSIAISHTKEELYKDLYEI